MYLHSKGLSDVGQMVVRLYHLGLRLLQRSQGLRRPSLCPTQKTGKLLGISSIMTKRKPTKAVVRCQPQCIFRIQRFKGLTAIAA
jgi:hypothetical protein